MTATLDRPIQPVFDQARYDAGKFDGLIEIIDPTGDTKLMWDKNNQTEVGIAKAAFDKAVEGKAAVFEVKGKDGEKGKRVKEFDPSLERLLVVPQLVGG